MTNIKANKEKAENSGHNTGNTNNTNDEDTNDNEDNDEEINFDADRSEEYSFVMPAEATLFSCVIIHIELNRTEMKLKLK